jgi:hypothetical protein
MLLRSNYSSISIGGQAPAARGQASDWSLRWYALRRWQKYNEPGPAQPPAHPSLRLDALGAGARDGLTKRGQAFGGGFPPGAGARPRGGRRFALCFEPARIRSGGPPDNRLSAEAPGRVAAGYFPNPRQVY